MPGEVVRLPDAIVTPVASMLETDPVWFRKWVWRRDNLPEILRIRNYAIGFCWTSALSATMSGRRSRRARMSAVLINGLFLQRLL